MKKIIAFVAVLLFLGAVFFIYAPKSKKVCYKEKCFQVEVADTESKREQGLMFRKKLDEGGGMLFIFKKEGIYPFWMKNTLIPLDIIWIGADKKVVFVENNAAPCHQENCPEISPASNALYVLEISGGAAKGIGLQAGDYLSFQ